MAIRLDILKPSKVEQASLDNGYLYKDISLDLSFTENLGEELFSTSSSGDLASITDGKAVINSVRNILTTTPGQKLLNPKLGLDLRSYLFEAVNTTVAYFIGRDIIENLGIQEPRMTLDTLSITADPDEGEYRININFSIPNLNIYNLSITAGLNKDGYVVL